MKLPRIILLLSIISLLIVACSCSTDNPSPVTSTANNNQEPFDNTHSTTLVITRDFGSRLIMEENIVFAEDMTAMDALQQVAEVETRYGGGFVDVINGLGSGYSDNHENKEDWFVFFNGIMSNIGALNYTLNPGDVQHWDYHNWDFRQFIPAIIGDFPEPFLHGYEGKIYPTVVTYQDGWRDEALRITDTLVDLGVTDTACRSLDELTASEKAGSNLVLLGDSEFAPISELNDVWNRLGYFCRFADGSLEVYNAPGDTAVEYHGNTGLIQATQSIWNSKGTGACENVVWMVTGTDAAGISTAVETMCQDYLDYQYACAVIINGDDLIRVP